MKDPLSSILIGEVLKDRATGSDIEFLIVEGYSDILNLANNADLLVVADESIEFLDEDVGPKFKRAVSEAIGPLFSVSVDDIEGDGYNVDTLDEQVVEIWFVVFEGELGYDADHTVEITFPDADKGLG